MSDLTTTLLPWMGWALSAVLVIIRTTELWRDRPGVVVSYKTGWRVTPNLFGYDPDKDHIVLEVVNKGRRPVTIASVGAIARQKGERDILMTDAVRGPRELTEGKATQYLLQQDLIDLAKFREFVVWDMTGRRYRCRIKKQGARDEQAGGTKGGGEVDLLA